jgi:hypothetical protein
VETEIVDVALLVAGALETLDVPYFVGGSVASTAYGMIRTTQDIDLVADLRPEHVLPFAEILGKSFYIDTEMILDAIQRRGSFNLLHYETAFKVDIFIPRARPYDQMQLDRRLRRTVKKETDFTLCFASPEDTILTKLEWYRMGHEVSERQWRDVIGVLKIQAERLDLMYLRQWAVDLGVIDLLVKALKEAEGE